ncbi:MAG: hypothetical protein ACC657_18835, partial [Thiohalomonadales bacterium]
MHNVIYFYNKLVIPILVALLTTMMTIGIIFYLADQNKKSQDIDKVTHLRRMIKKGSVSSLVTLGEMYESGQGVKKDLNKAQELFRRAISY